MKTYSGEDIDFSSYDQVMDLYENFEDECERTGWIGFLGIQSKSEVESCYLLEKPVTMVEIVAPSDKVEELSRDLEDYFYTCILRESQVETEEGEYHQLYVSRFKSLIDVADEFLDSTDERADLSGVLFGYKPLDIAGYCDEQSNGLFK